PLPGRRSPARPARPRLDHRRTRRDTPAPRSRGRRHHDRPSERSPGGADEPRTVGRVSRPATARPSIPLMYTQALVRHCPRCGAGGLFRGWFKMVERCPGCGCHFEGRAEEGHFLGAYTLNLGITSGVLLLGIFLYIVVL